MKEISAMASLQVDPARPALTSEQTLTGWRREFCVECSAKVRRESSCELWSPLR
jgi:hypothetical protein